MKILYPACLFGLLGTLCDLAGRPDAALVLWVASLCLSAWVLGELAGQLVWALFLGRRP